MKKTLSIMMFTAALLVGCSQEMDITSENTGSITLTLATDVQYVNEPLLTSTEVSSMLQTRTTAISRYVIEVYTDEACTTPANIFGTTNRKEQTDATFALSLDKTQTYHCLLWADEGNGTYNVANLKTVTLVDGKQPTDAYYAKAALSMKTTQTATLKHAVALINLKDKSGVVAGKVLNLKYTQPTQFNVLDQTVSGSQNVDRNITTATTAANEAITSFYMLAPVSQASLFSLVFSYDGQPAKTLEDLPLQANYTTGITGNYAPIVP